MIEIKTLFTDWHEASKEQAKKYVLHFKNGITNMSEEKKIKYINSKIRGARIVGKSLIGIETEYESKAK